MLSFNSSQASGHNRTAALIFNSSEIINHQQTKVNIKQHYLMFVLYLCVYIICCIVLHFLWDCRKVNMQRQREGYEKSV